MTMAWTPKLSNDIIVLWVLNPLEADFSDVSQNDDQTKRE